MVGMKVRMMAHQIEAIEGVLREIKRERIRQHDKWGEQNHPDRTGEPGDAEMAEMVRSTCNMAARGGALTWRHILDEEVWEALAESDPDKLRAELIQVAAVATAWIEAIDRRKKAPPVSE